MASFVSKGVCLWDISQRWAGLIPHPRASLVSTGHRPSASKSIEPTAR